jgi:hypothetical protein
MSSSAELINSKVSSLACCIDCDKSEKITKSTAEPQIPQSSLITAKEVLANYDNVLKEQTPEFSGVATV